jgi:predicted nucleic acid-binding protein
MPRPVVVVDTNVFVAAGFNPRSTSARILEAVERGQLRMMWNDATRREIERVLHRIPPLRGRAATRVFRPEGRVTVDTRPERFAEIPDADDWKFAALAHAAGATLISSDAHLLRYCGPLELTVLAPGSFWRRHRRAKGIRPTSLDDDER